MLNIVNHSVQFSLVQFSRSVMSDSLQRHELQHARPQICQAIESTFNVEESRSTPWFQNLSAEMMYLPFIELGKTAVSVG